jgi:hypothetical protein
MPIVAGVLLLAMVWAVVQFAGLLEAHHNFVTAIATAVIAVFTITLWLSGWFQLRHGREVDRAYLTGGGDIELDGAGKEVFRLEVENIGRTAAFMSTYDVKFATFAQVQRPQPVRPVDETAYTHDDRLGPAGSTRSSFKALRTPVFVSQGADIIYGAVWYTDIWHQPHRFRFILRIHRDRHARTDVDNVDDGYRGMGLAIERPRAPEPHHRSRDAPPTETSGRLRLERAALFVAKLHELSRTSPKAWRRAEAIGRDAGIDPAEIEQAVDDAERVGLIHRRSDDPQLVLLTDQGRAVTAGH